MSAAAVGKQREHDELARIVAAERNAQDLPATIIASAALHRLAARIRSVSEPDTPRRRRRRE